MGFTSEIKDTAKGPHAIGGLYLLMLGLILSDAIPTVADAAFFNKQRSLRNDWKQGKISPEAYWREEAWAYYAYNVIYWIIVATIVVIFGKSAKQKVYIAGGLIGGGGLL